MRTAKLQPNAPQEPAGSLRICPQRPDRPDDPAPSLGAVTQRSRQDAIETLRDARARLTALIDGLSDMQLQTSATLGGGSWSIKDLLGHLASWEERALHWLERGGAPPKATYPPTDEFNAAEVERKARSPLDVVKDETRRSHKRLIEAIESTPDELWLSRVPVDGDTLQLGQLVGMILAGDDHGPFAHDLAHLADVEAYVRSLD